MAVVLQMDLQEDTSTQVVDDSSPSNNNGSIQGGSTATTEDISVDGPGGLFPKAFRLDVLDGTEFVQFGGIDPAPTSSDIEFFAKLDSNGGVSDVFLLETVPFQALTINAASRTITVKSASGVRSLIFDLPIAHDFTLWHKYAVIIDNDNGTLKVDDVDVDTSVSVGFGLDGFSCNVIGTLGDSTTAITICGARITDNTFYPLQAPVSLIGATFERGLARVGVPLIQTNPAAFSGNPTPTFARQWFRYNDRNATNAVSIPGATSTGYTPTSDDLGKFLRQRTRATNSEGTADAFSEFLGVYQTAPATAVRLTAPFSNLSSFHGKFLLTQAISDVSGASIPDPVTWKNESPQNTIDWSFTAIAGQSRLNVPTGSLIAPSFVVTARHAPPTTLYFLQQNNVEISRTVVESWIIHRDLMLCRLNAAINAIQPIGMFVDSSVVSGKNVIAIEADRHLNVMVADQVDNNDELFTVLMPGPDDIEGGDSSEPCVILVETTPVLVMTGFFGAESGGNIAYGPNPSHYLIELSSIVEAFNESIIVYQRRPPYRPPYRPGISLGMGL